MRPATFGLVACVLVRSACAADKIDWFGERLLDAFASDLRSHAFEAPSQNAPPPERRIPSAPFDSPPFPSGDWQIGGTPIIGDRGYVGPWPLMQAIYAGPARDAFRKSGIQIYGWEAFSWNASTSTNTSRGPNANLPLIYDLRPNRFEQNQFVLYIERVPNEFQTEHIDWGCRVSAVYGLDYRFMISRGLFSRQLLKENNHYGFDMPMVHFDLYLPQFFQGINVRIGRIISEPDIEAQLAPNNLMASHSLVYGFDNYTQSGIFTTTKLNQQWTVQIGLSNGTDIAPWQDDPGNQPTGTAMVQWISPSQTDSIYTGDNAFNNGEFGYNNLRQLVGTWTHKFYDRIYTATEALYMYMFGAKTHSTSKVPFQSGSFPMQPGYAPEWGVVNYTMLRITPNAFFTVRNEFYNDIAGSRASYATKYTEHSLGLTWWPNKIMTLRPELRFDHSYDTAAFDNGTRRNQLVASMDFIIHY